ncbi:hypothetical protein MPRM_04250 [Mycobacterium parmense]|uniref:Peptidoglycan recognition protein family domain-containing protein n=1 Tax=Mycobacterium parmense TaxID=185642 RepID=A0A7I7YPQ8_9MYCO|nr:hypothetical protein MPRM_04250 [Mycobacterium parmense]
MLKYVAAAPVALGLGMAADVLLGPAPAPADPNVSAAAMAASQPVEIISRARWGANESLRRALPRCDSGVRAGIVHHSATGNNYAPSDSAAIVRSIYEYHAVTEGWGDIGYNALVDKYGQVFEGRFGGITNPVEGVHTGGFNANTWAVCMIGDYSQAPPTPDQLRAVGELLGWRLAMDMVNPRGTVALTSAGGPNTRFPQGATPTLPSIFAHRDVGDTACPGNAGYAFMDQIRDIAAQFKQPPSTRDFAPSLQGGAIYDRWQAMGGASGPLGAPTSPEAPSGDSIRYVVFANGAIYWSPATGAQPLTGRIYEAWATLRYERGPLGLPTSAEIDEPEWVVQNFQHGTLNFERHTSTVVTVMDGVASVVPPPPAGGPPMQLERFSAARNPVV